MEGLQMKYFVLNPKSKFFSDVYAEASRLAMLRYAKEISKIDQQFADDLVEWVHKEVAELDKWRKEKEE